MINQLKEVMVTPNRRHFDPNLAPHGHFVCRVCRSICDLPAGGRDMPTVFDLSGYAPEEYAFSVYGVCPGCLDREGQ